MEQKLHEIANGYRTERYLTHRKIMESSCWKGCTNKPKRTSNCYGCQLQCPRRKDTKVWVQISTLRTRMHKTSRLEFPESCSANNSLRARKYKVNIKDHGSDLNNLYVAKRMLCWHRPTTTTAICIVLNRTCAIAESNRLDLIRHWEPIQSESGKVGIPGWSGFIPVEEEDPSRMASASGDYSIGRGPWRENDGDEMKCFESLSGTRRGTTRSQQLRIRTVYRVTQSLDAICCQTSRRLLLDDFWELLGYRPCRREATSRYKGTPFGAVNPLLERV
ncbi:hypothetical protein B0H14DRAFT_2929348 [Mycena olivaceomarginata]|nr:hypothetical protein B0H14DRAFT_2929348 [Mycena olivaceomarginata]